MTDRPRILLVHAHPDDETITTGGTIAALVDEGALVTVLTATRGEGGEVIPAELKSLEGDRSGLARVREQEISAALTVLGVTDHRFLGGTVRTFEDSGMAWGPDGHAIAAPDMPAAALCAAPLADVAAHIADVIDDVRPHVLITYSANGGYGHPDHVRVHEATVSACGRSAWQPGRLLFVEVPVDVAEGAFDPRQPGFAETGFQAAATIPTKAPEAPVDIAEDISSVLPKKAAALAAHRTQVSVSGDFFALSNGVGMRIVDHEYFTLSAGQPLPDGKPTSPTPPPAVPGTAASAPSTGPADSTGPAPAVLAGLDLAAVEAQPGSQFPRRERPVRKPGVLAYAHAVLLGLLVGFLGAMQHLNVAVVHLGGQPVIAPWGLGLALLLAAAAYWHLKTLYRSSGPMLVAAFAVALLSYLFGQPQLLPGADLIVTGALRSVVWLLGPMLIAAVVAFIRIPRR